MSPSKPNQLCYWNPPVAQARVTEVGPLRRMVQTMSTPHVVQRVIQPTGAGDKGLDITLTVWSKAIKVRMVPGDPTTLADAWVNELEILPSWNHQDASIPKFYLHFAEVWNLGRLTGRSYFPTDMCRCDRCLPEDYTLDIDGEEGSLNQPTFLPSQKIRVVQVSRMSQPCWTPARWNSFGWEINPLVTVLVRHGEAQFGEVHKWRKKA